MTVYTTLPEDDQNLDVVLTEDSDLVTLNIQPASVSITGAVSSVNGQTGDVVLTTTQIPEGTNEYYTDGKVDAHLTGGTGVTYTAGDISIGQPVGTGDDVTFNSVAFGTDTTLSWNPTDFTLDMPLDGVTIQLGQETVARVLNKTGADLDNGKVVRVTGAQGNRMTVALADNSSDALSGTILGIMTEPTLNNQQGFTTITGLVRNIDTSAFADGDVLYLGSAGNITNVQPATPLHLITVGYCVRSHPTVGSIFAFPQNGYEMNELHDVLITNVQNNDLLSWDSVNSYWKNITNDYITATALTPYYTSAQVDALPVSTFSNDAGYLTTETDSQTLSFANPDLTISNGNTVDLSALTPTSLAWSAITGTPTTISGYGITDAFSGDYNDLTNKPDLTPYATTTYVDTQDGVTLTSANTYTDNAVAIIDGETF